MRATVSSERVLPQGLRLDGSDFAIAVGYVVVYVLLDWLSYIQPVLKLGITPWNPTAGLTLALLRVRGARWAPATALAVFVAEELVRDAPAAWPVLLAASAWIACLYGVLASVLARWSPSPHLDTPSGATRLIVSAAVATLLVAVGYVMLFVATSRLPMKLATGAVARYWVGDLNGILTLTPLLLYADRWRAGWHQLQRYWALIAVQFGIVAVVMWLIFGITDTDQTRFFYLLFVPMIWISLRWGAPGAALGALMIQVGLVAVVEGEPGATELVDLQFLLLTLCLTALLLGAVVTERVDALRQVAMRETEQRALLATAPDAVLTADAAGRIRSANPAAVRLFGSQVAGGSGWSLHEMLPAIQLHSAEGRAMLEGRRADGGVFPAEIAWARLDAPGAQGLLVIVRDITERRRAEAQLRERETALSHAMRFAVAGELASALAHELNQPITALVSYLHASEILAAPLVSQDVRLQETLGKATHEAIRASEVLRRLRDFYSGGAIKREQLVLPAFCSNFAMTFQERLRRGRVELLLDVPETLPGVETGATQLEIVLHNLLSNAIDALGEQPLDSRHIEVSARVRSRTCWCGWRIPDRGVAAEIIHRVFEPFVTTKVDGMGLGLAISRSLLRGQGGELTYEPGTRWRGACFVVRLPIGPPRAANG